MVAQSSLGRGDFWPFTQMFETYVNGLTSVTSGFGAQGPDLQALGSQFTGPAKAVARCQLEAMGLASRRAQAYLDLPARIARCKTPQDLIREQSDFWRTALEQYAESAERIGTAWGQAFIPAGFGAGSGQRRERDYITFPSAKDANGQGAGAPAPESRHHRRVA